MTSDSYYAPNLHFTECNLVAFVANCVGISGDRLLLSVANEFQFLPRDARSAKRGIAIVSRPSVRPSVRLSVTLTYREHIGWTSSKLITRIISINRSLIAFPLTPKHVTLNYLEWPFCIKLYFVPVCLEL